MVLSTISLRCAEALNLTTRSQQGAQRLRRFVSVLCMHVFVHVFQNDHIY